MFRSDGPKADLTRDHKMHGNRRVALAGEPELVESAPLPCPVALPIIFVISLAAWRSLDPSPNNHVSKIVDQAKRGRAGGEETAAGSGDRCTKSAERIQKRSSRRSRDAGGLKIARAHSGRRQHLDMAPMHRAQVLSQFEPFFGQSNVLRRYRQERSVKSDAR